MNHAEGLELAKRLVALLEPVCARVVIAGSLRRRQPEVGDIDLVAELASDVPARIAQARLDSRVVSLLRDGTLKEATGKKAMGEKQKRFLVSSGIIRTYVEGDKAGTREHDLNVYIDLCSVETANFGYRLALSTGDADWNKLLVTARSLGGLKDDPIVLCKGAVYRAGVQVAVPNERAFFAALGLPFVAPQERCKTRALELIGDLRRAEKAYL